MRALAMGVITSATRSPILNKTVALARVDVTHSETGTQVEVGKLDGHQKRLPARIVRFPHYPALAEDFAGLPPGEGEAVVVGDAAQGFSYAALNAAFRKLLGGAEFVALARNRSLKDEDGALSLDTGAFVAALEYASGQEAVVLGKPAPDFFRAAVAALGCAPEQAVMVGDDVESDVGGAMAAGLQGILVKTGKYRDGDEARIEPPPTAVVETLAGAVEWILERISRRTRQDLPGEV
jgi:HAD superfamily hydrolase (TIGR01458 family)